MLRWVAERQPGRDESVFGFMNGENPAAVALHAECFKQARPRAARGFTKLQLLPALLNTWTPAPAPFPTTDAGILVARRHL